MYKFIKDTYNVVFDKLSSRSLFYNKGINLAVLYILLGYLYIVL